MTYVLEMSTDRDILGTRLNAAWNPVTRYSWAQVSGGGLDIPAGATIVVIAHGNADTIGNADGPPDIDPAEFITLIRGNMAGGGVPGTIYISTCSDVDVAAYAAHVALTAERARIWSGMWIYGHNDAVAGTVPPPFDGNPHSPWSSVHVN